MYRDLNQCILRDNKRRDSSNRLDIPPPSVGGHFRTEASDTQAGKRMKVKEKEERTIARGVVVQYGLPIQSIITLFEEIGDDSKETCQSIFRYFPIYRHR